MIRYGGVFAPASGWRRRIVPKEAIHEIETTAHEKKTETEKGSHDHKRRYAWSELLKRVFAVDALKCAKCGNTMKILCAVNPPDAIRKILNCLGLPSRPPPIFPVLIRHENGQPVPKPIKSTISDYSSESPYAIALSVPSTPIKKTLSLYGISE